MPLIVFTLWVMILNNHVTTIQCIGLSLLITGVYMIGDRMYGRERI